MRPSKFFALALIACSLGSSAPAQSPAASGQPVIANGNFDDPSDPLKGWVTDYAFAGNSYYMGNKNLVSVAKEGGKNVVKFAEAPAMAGTKMECQAFPFEPGFKYVCNIKIKGTYRLYFSGYQWVPGTHPHENPTLGELRQIYKSKAIQGASAEFKDEKLELPGVKLSPDALEYVKKIKFLTVYIYVLKTGEVASVNVTKIPDPTMNFAN